MGGGGEDERHDGRDGDCPVTCVTGRPMRQVLLESWGLLMQEGEVTQGLPNPRIPRPTWAHSRCGGGEGPALRCWCPAPKPLSSFLGFWTWR